MPEALKITAAAPRVVMLSSAHAATDDRIFYREALSLTNAGFEVSVVGRHPCQESVEGVRICPLPAKGGRAQRFLAGWQILKLARQLCGDLYIFHDPDLWAVGLMLRLLGKRVVYDSHENVPKQVLQKDWLPWVVRYALFPLVWVAESLGGYLLSGVIAAVPVIASRFPQRKAILVRNFPTPETLRVFDSGKNIRERGNIAIYAGGLSPIRGIRELVTAFRGMEGAELWLAGQFDDPEFEAEVLSSLPPNVKWLGWKPFPEMIRLYNSAKLGMLPLYPTPNHRNSLPVKLFEYLGAGLPVVYSDFPEFCSLVDGCGTAVDPYDPAAIRTAVRALVRDQAKLSGMSALARHRARQMFCWEEEGKRLVDFCRCLVSVTRDLESAGKGKPRQTQRPGVAGTDRFRAA
jgi:glycosyltransferase involved in cell wall biosynthesis